MKMLLLAALLTGEAGLGTVHAAEKKDPAAATFNQLQPAGRDENPEMTGA